MSDVERDEPQRQCPACRNWVSFLATRCHHCGETLGRPRKEEIRKTIKDLGGESHSQYTVSGNVMDALEAFREENLSEAEGLRRQKEEMSQTWFGRKQAISDAPHGTQVQMPELQGEHKSLADEILGESTVSRTPAPVRRDYNSDTIRNAGIGVVVLIALGLGYLFVVPSVRQYLDERNKPVVPEHVNHTRELLNAGAAPFEVLQEARAAMDVVANPANQLLIEAARDYVEKTVRDLMSTDTFDDDKLDEASALASQCVRIDPSDRMQKLAAEVASEVTAHKFILVSVDPAGGKASFKLNNPSAGADSQQVSVGEMLEGRFIVTAITSTSVRLEDTKRVVHGRQRALVSRPFQAVSAN